MKRVSWLKAGHSKVIYFITDALGTVRDIVNSSGLVRASYEFDESGRRISTFEDGVSSQKTFLGAMSVQDEFSETGLMMMGHRFYDPDLLGRFVNRDPIGFGGGLNLFEYSQNSPTSKTDATGLKPENRDGSGGILAGLGGLVAAAAIGTAASSLFSSLSAAATSAIGAAAASISASAKAVGKSILTTIYEGSVEVLDTLIGGGSTAGGGRALRGTSGPLFPEYVLSAREIAIAAEIKELKLQATSFSECRIKALGLKFNIEIKFNSKKSNFGTTVVDNKPYIELEPNPSFSVVLEEFGHYFEWLRDDKPVGYTSLEVIESERDIKGILIEHGKRIFNLTDIDVKILKLELEDYEIRYARGGF